jgi:hypothetical protein
MYSSRSRRSFRSSLYFANISRKTPTNSDSNSTARRLSEPFRRFLRGSRYRTAPLDGSTACLEAKNDPICATSGRGEERSPQHVDVQGLSGFILPPHQIRQGFPSLSLCRRGSRYTERPGASLFAFWRAGDQGISDGSYHMSIPQNPAGVFAHFFSTHLWPALCPCPKHPRRLVGTTPTVPCLVVT